MLWWVKLNVLVHNFSIRFDYSALPEKHLNVLPWCFLLISCITEAQICALRLLSRYGYSSCALIVFKVLCEIKVTLKAEHIVLFVSLRVGFPDLFQLTSRFGVIINFDMYWLN